jgi:hypothetical protein
LWAAQYLESPGAAGHSDSAEVQWIIYGIPMVLAVYLPEDRASD